MSVIWWYLIAFVIAFILGFIIVALLYKLIQAFQNRSDMRKVPDSKQELLDPGKPKEISIKEVEEDERIKFEKYREFEKLRRVADRERKSPTTTPFYTSSFGQQQPSDVQNKSDTNAPKHRKSVKFD